MIGYVSLIRVRSSHHTRVEHGIVLNVKWPSERALSLREFPSIVRAQRCDILVERIFQLANILFSVINAVNIVGMRSSLLQDGARRSDEAPRRLHPRDGNAAVAVD